MLEDRLLRNERCLLEQPFTLDSGRGLPRHLKDLFHHPVGLSAIDRILARDVILEFLEPFELVTRLALILSHHRLVGECNLLRGLELHLYDLWWN